MAIPIQLHHVRSANLLHFGSTLSNNARRYFTWAKLRNHQCNFTCSHPGIIWTTSFWSQSWSTWSLLWTRTRNIEYSSCRSEYLSFSEVLTFSFFTGGLSDHFQKESYIIVTGSHGTSSKHCLGRKCFQYTFFVTAGLCILASLLSFGMYVAHKRARIKPHQPSECVGDEDQQ